MSLRLPILFALTLHAAIGVAQSRPQPGDLYREFTWHSRGDKQWRVTDQDAVIKHERAGKFLPNPTLQLEIDDLQYAIGAEALLDRWGGHRGTVNKRVRFNNHEWIGVAEINSVPEGIRPEMLMFQDNPVVKVPIEQLTEGVNEFTADCDESGGFGWGQWGMYSLVLRVYYDREKKGRNYDITGKILTPMSGQSIGDDPQIDVEASARMGVARVDLLASYDGFDEDGDGDGDGWHESHFQLARGGRSEIRDHVGTRWKQPYTWNWNTYWLTDQHPEAISLIARIQDSRGYWSVTEPVTKLTLVRKNVRVKIYRARDVPENFAVRVGETKTCYFDIPPSDRIEQATETALHLRTWHGWDGHHEPLRINSHAMPIGGKNHFYDYDLLAFPPSALRSGESVFTIHSKTEHHMLEVLWPGPAIVARLPRDDALENRRR